MGRCGLGSAHASPPCQVRATHPDCSVILYFQEREDECLEAIRSESQTQSPGGQRGENPHMHGKRVCCGGWVVVDGEGVAVSLESLREKGERGLSLHLWDYSVQTAIGGENPIVIARGPNPNPALILTQP